MRAAYSQKRMFSSVCFICAVVFCLTPWSSPSVALFLGLVLSMTVGHPWKKYNAKAVKRLLQISVVGLGFGVHITEVVAAGKSGVLFSAISIMGTLALGYVLGRVFAVSKKISYLISVGTAICGGSAIAAVAPVIEADEHEVAVSLGTVFILNAVALFLFPWLGHLFNMSFHQFGLWAALAIHDTSSVVGAAAQFGSDAVKVATTVKLARALWIMPVAFLTAAFLHKRKSRISFPYFIVAFVVASISVTLLPSFHAFFSGIVCVAHRGLTLTLFLIGAGLSIETLREVGFMPIIQALILWAMVSCVSFCVIYFLA